MLSVVTLVKFVSASRTTPRSFMVEKIVTTSLAGPD